MNNFAATSAHSDAELFPSVVHPVAKAWRPLLISVGVVWMIKGIGSANDLRLQPTYHSLESRFDSLPEIMQWHVEPGLRLAAGLIIVLLGIAGLKMWTARTFLPTVGITWAVAALWKPVEAVTHDLLSLGGVVYMDFLFAPVAQTLTGVGLLYAGVATASKRRRVSVLVRAAILLFIATRVARTVIMVGFGGIDSPATIAVFLIGGALAEVADVGAAIAVYSVSNWLVPRRTVDTMEERFTEDWQSPDE